MLVRGQPWVSILPPFILSETGFPIVFFCNICPASWLLFPLIYLGQTLGLQKTTLTGLALWDSRDSNSDPRAYCFYPLEPFPQTLNFFFL